MREPPQTCRPALNNAAIHGHSPRSAFWPPTIRSCSWLPFLAPHSPLLIGTALVVIKGLGVVAPGHQLGFFVGQVVALGFLVVVGIYIGFCVATGWTGWPRRFDGGWVGRGGIVWWGGWVGNGGGQEESGPCGRNPGIPAGSFPDCSNQYRYFRNFSCHKFKYNGVRVQIGKNQM